MTVGIINLEEDWMDDSEDETDSDYKPKLLKQFNESIMQGIAEELKCDKCEFIGKTRQGRPR